MTCEACGGELQRDLAELDVQHSRGRATVAQAGWYCWKCGVARFSVADLYEAERQLQFTAPAEVPTFLAASAAPKAA